MTSNDRLEKLIGLKRSIKLSNYEEWTWVSSSGSRYYLNRMPLNHIVSAARMLWNRWFVKHFNELKPVQLGKDWDLEHRSVEEVYKSMCMFLWFVVNQRMREIQDNKFCDLREIFTEIYTKAHASKMFPDWVFEYNVRQGHDSTKLWKDEVDELPVGTIVIGCGATAIRIEGVDVVPTKQEIPKEFFMSKKIQCVLVSFGDSRNYEYFSVIEDLKVDDLVVVEAGNTYGLATVVAVDVPKSKASKWVIQKVSTKIVDGIKADITKAREIKKALDEKLELQRERIVYQTLADKDPEAKALLDQLKELEG
jgi:hypothetical protein